MDDLYVVAILQQVNNFIDHYSSIVHEQLRVLVINSNNFNSPYISNLHHFVSDLFRSATSPHAQMMDYSKLKMLSFSESGLQVQSHLIGT